MRFQIDNPSRQLVLVTLVAGGLDLAGACAFASRHAMTPVEVLQFVASGPFGDSALGSPLSAPAGLLVHFAIMAVMVGFYRWLAGRRPALFERPLLAGAGYGLLLWFVMYWIVRPLRWERLPPPTDPRAITEQLFCHVLLVGIPIAFLTLRLRLRQPTPRAAAR